jgi:Mg-chelatase subunit ChlD
VISAEDRWRLILGVERDQLAAPAVAIASALDELYGEGRGEGSNAGLGVEQSSPTTREWASQLEELFGRSVRDHVLARAIGRGRADALPELDPETVTPSVELLHHLLALKGGLSEDRLDHLRRMVERVTKSLVQELSTRLRPALVGSIVPRPTRRTTGVLDLRRTVAGSLRSVRFHEDGTPRVVPDRLIFKTRARRSLDWRIILVVDISGSMEESVIYSALMAAILSGLPAVTTHFVAFSTSVVDLSHRVQDPLSLLMEVVVGGGTNIARGLRYARQLMTVPRRTLVILVTDFEEGGALEPLLAEVRAIAESGAHPLGLAALDDRGAPRYTRGVAEEVVAAGMPVAALTPLELARWVSEQIT